MAILLVLVLLPSGIIPLVSAMADEAETAEEFTSDNTPLTEDTPSFALEPNNESLIELLGMDILPLAAGDVEVSGQASGTFATLIAAMSFVNSSTAGTYTITLTKNETLSGTLTINSGRDVTITSAGSLPFTIKQTATTLYMQQGIFTVNGSLTLQSIILEGYPSTLLNSSGAVNVNSGKLTMENGSTIRDFYATNGGAVYINAGATFTLNGGLLTNNRAQNWGGAVRCAGGTFTMNGGVISNNSCRFYGGGVSVNTSGTFTMSGGVITENKATGTSNPGGSDGGGGGVHIDSGTFTMNNGLIANNEAQGTSGAYENYGGGGGVYVASTGSLSVKGGTISDNRALSGNGGAIYTENKDYSWPTANTVSYANISIGPKAVISANTASVYTSPPTNEASFTARPSNPFNGNLLTNNSINYRPNNLYVVILYNANGGVGSDFAQGTTTAAGTTVSGLTIKNLPATGIAPPPRAEFDRWDTLANGTGTSYAADQYPVSINARTTLYAQWFYPERYFVTRNSDGSRIDTFHSLSDAVNACEPGVACTITLMWEDDTDMSETNPGAVTIPSNKSITLTSDNGARTITQLSSSRHFIVEGDLTLEGIILDGNANTTGGVNVATNGSLTSKAGAIIQNCGGSANGGAVQIASNGAFTLAGGSVAHNLATANGGGVWVASSGRFCMTGGSVVGNQAPNGDGGGIFTENYRYVDPLTDTDYRNISIAPTCVVSGNTASSLCAPPSNAEVFNYRSLNSFEGTLLTNANINYHNPGNTIVIIYNANGGSGADYVFDTHVPLSNAPALVDLKTLSQIGITPPPRAVLGSWNTSPDGTGTSYAAGATQQSIPTSRELYAQWSYPKPYVVTNGGGSVVGSYHWLADAVDACGASGYTITLTGVDDGDMTDYLNQATSMNAPFIGASTSGSDATVAIPNGKSITLTSDNGARTILQRSMARHLVVNGTLMLQGIVLQGLGYTSGERINGGIDVGNYITNGAFIMGAGTVIQSCYAGDSYGSGHGGGVAVYSGSFTMQGGVITANTAQRDGGGIYLFFMAPLVMTGGSVTGNRAVSGKGGGIFSEDYYAYADNMDASYCYTDISIAYPAFVGGNTASKLVVPPSNAADFTTRAYSSFDGTLLNNYNINYWREDNNSAATLSKVVTGEYADKTYPFEFIVSVKDNTGKLLKGEAFKYTGSIVAGSGAVAPSDGIVTLDTTTGQASVYLKHGQAITFADLPSGYQVQFTETFAHLYTPSFTETGGGSGTNDTGFLTINSPARTIAFENERDKVVPAGVEHGTRNPSFIYFSLVVVAVITAGFIGYKLSLSRRRQRSN